MTHSGAECAFTINALPARATYLHNPDAHCALRRGCVLYFLKAHHQNVKKRMAKERIRHAVGVYKKIERAEKVYAKVRNQFWVAIVSPKGFGVNVEHLSRTRV